MNFSINRQHIEQAMDCWDAFDFPNKLNKKNVKDSGAYDIIHNDCRYPPAVIMEIALRAVNPNASLADIEHVRSKPTYDRLLTSLGFKIEKKFPEQHLPTEVREKRLSLVEWKERLKAEWPMAIRDAGGSDLTTFTKSGFNWKITFWPNMPQSVMIKWTGSSEIPGRPKDVTKKNPQLGHHFSRWCRPCDLQALIAELENLERKPENSGEMTTLLVQITELERSLEDNELISPLEKDAIIKQRIGQSKYREGLLTIWGGCSVTGVKSRDLLVASHIKPWRNCEPDEKLDPENGLVLTPHLDRLFDRNLISFDADGSIMICNSLPAEDLAKLGIHRAMRLARSSDKLMQYMSQHRMEFRNRERDTKLARRGE